MAKNTFMGSAKKGGAVDMFKDNGNEDGEGAPATGGAELEGRDIDPEALAFIKAKRKVDDLHKAKKHEKKV